MCNSVHHNHAQRACQTQPKRVDKSPEKAYRVETVKGPDGSEQILSVKDAGREISKDEVLLQSTPFGLDCNEGGTEEVYLERYVAESALTDKEQAKYAEKLFKSKPEWEGAEVRTLINQGPTENRIDLTIVGDGTQTRDFTYIDDVVSGVIAAIDKNHDYEVFNLGNHNPERLEDMIDLIEENIGKKAVNKKT